MRKRLQNLPSPNETARLTNRAINSRRLPQKQDFCFHSVASCIEEKEEEEERLSLPKKSFNALKAKDARARRREKTRLEAVTGTMVVSQPDQVDDFEPKSGSNNLNPTIESNLGLPSLLVETPRNCSRYTPSSEDTPASAYRSQTFDNDSFRLQRNAFSQPEESPKDRIELRALSPASLGRSRPTKFGGYRPPAGVILQNLSSGSEPESLQESALHRIVPGRKIASPSLSNEINQTFSACLSSVSSTFGDSATNGGAENLVASPLFITEGGNGRLASTPLPSLREEDIPSRKLLDIRRRDSVHDKQLLGSPLAMPPVQLHGDVSPKILENGTFVDAYPILTGFEKNGPEGIPELRSKIGPSIGNCENKSMKFPLSARLAREEAALSSQFRSWMSDGGAVSSREFKGLSSRASVKESIKDDQRSIDSGNQNLDNYVPTLALNSQEISYSASPDSKASTGNHLNTNALIMALSNVSLKQQANSLEGSDNRTLSRYCKSTVTSEEREGTKSSGNRSRSNASSSVRSKIPVKIASHRTNLVFNRFPEVKEQPRSEVSSTDTERRCETRASPNFGRTYSLSEDGSTKRQTSIDENECKENAENLTYPASNRASTNRTTVEDTTRTTSFSGTEKEDKGNPAEDSDSIPSESEPIEDSFPTVPVILNAPESKPQSYEKFIHSPKLESCQARYSETESSLIEVQIGDSVRQEAFKRPSSNSSAEDKETKTERVRVSLEKLAADQIRRSFCPDPTQAIPQSQSETETLVRERFHEGPGSSLVHSSSTSKLRLKGSPRFARKSQERFPFTISEKPSAASMKFQISRRLENLDSKSVERTYKLSMHPSLTRLAGTGLEETPAEIINYVMYDEREPNEPSSSGMKRFVQRFSAKLRGSKKSDKVRPDEKATSVIYKNRTYCGDSTVDSCSESSLLKEFKIYERAIDSLDARASICSQRGYKHAWTEAPEHLDHDETTVAKEECESQRNPYSMFFVKSAGETPETFLKPCPSDEEQKQEGPASRRKNRVKFRSSSLAIASKAPDENVHKTLVESRHLENTSNRRSEDRGCLCLRFYRMMVPNSFSSVSKYQSRASRNRQSVRKRSGLLLRKKKR